MPSGGKMPAINEGDLVRATKKLSCIDGVTMAEIGTGGKVVVAFMDGDINNSITVLFNNGRKVYFPNPGTYENCGLEKIGI